MTRSGLFASCRQLWPDKNIRSRSNDTPSIARHRLQHSTVWSPYWVKLILKPDVKTCLRYWSGFERKGWLRFSSNKMTYLDGYPHRYICTPVLGTFLSSVKISWIWTWSKVDWPLGIEKKKLLIFSMSVSNWKLLFFPLRDIRCH
jgi:hypothetical protein